MERRREERITVDVNLTCRAPARPCRATIIDVSREGCQIQVKDGMIELGATAVLEMPSIAPVSGRIVWTRDRVAGVRFMRPLAGGAAVALGLDQPQQTPPQELPVPVEAPHLGGFLRHWIRRLMDAPARS